MRREEEGGGRGGEGGEGRGRPSVARERYMSNHCMSRQALHMRENERRPERREATLCYNVYFFPVPVAK